MRSSFGRSAITATGLATLMLCAGVVPTAGARTADVRTADVRTARTPAQAPQPSISDTRLLQEINTRAGHRRTTQSESIDIQRVPVEVLTSDTAAVAAATRRLGGDITGTVPGQLVQAIVPVDQLDSLARTPGATFVQYPRLVSRREPTEVANPDTVAAGAGAAGAEFGPFTAQPVSITNAAAWHSAGITGAGVRVGVIDYFDLTVWNIAEHGPVPTVANDHLFCRDSLGVAVCFPDGSIVNDVSGGNHGVAVVETVKDMAPGADIYIASVTTASDLLAAVDWFAAHGVAIITRSLGAAFDGPGDGTGPLAAVVDAAAARGITWFNSGGNDAAGGYMRFTATDVDNDGRMEFGPDGDELLRINHDIGLGRPACNFWFDGIRWSNDWYLPAAQVTDYRIEVYESTVFTLGQHFNPSDAQLRRLDFDGDPTNGTQQVTYDSNQRTGAPPLEAVDGGYCVTNGAASFLRIVRNTATPIGAVPDTIEIALGSSAILESDYSDVAGSAAKPVVDSRNPALVAVGAVDPAAGSTIASYSSQGPTTDGRIKPDMSAPSCYALVVWGSCFNGTSAASPVAAGMAALLLGRGLAVSGAPLAALTKHLVTDLGIPGPDNVFGSGKARLPAVPTGGSTAPGVYRPLSVPTRLLDTRTASAVGPGNLIGAQPISGLLDLPVIGGIGGVPVEATSVAVNITSVGSVTGSYLQAAPTLRSTLGGFSTLNVATAGQTRPNFAIVPIGEAGSISLYMPLGGNVIVDLLGYFQPSGGPRPEGRLIALDPVRVLDTRANEAGPVPSGWSPHRPAANETVRVELPATSGLPAAGVAAVVVNITASEAGAEGFLRAMPTGTAGATTSNVNYLPGANSATHAIVPLGADGTISIFTNATTHILVDVEGYITNTAATSSGDGQFVSVPPGRAYDSRTTGGIHTGGSARPVQLTGSAIPTGASAVSLNLTTDQQQAGGFVTLYPLGSTQPRASNLNFDANRPVANAGLIKVSPLGGVAVFVNQTTHVIIDVNGYFTGPA